MKNNADYRVVLRGMLLVSIVFLVVILIGCGGGGGGGDDYSGSSSTDTTETCTITGYVYDGSGDPVDGATVSWSSKGKEESSKDGSTVTNSRGEFTLSKVAGGNVVITASKGSMYCEQELYASPGSVVETILETDSYGYIRGWVYDADTHSLLSGVTVTLSQNSQEVDTQYTDDSGVFYFTWVNAGEYTLSTSKVNYYSSSTTVTVSENETAFHEFTITSYANPSPTPTVTSSPTPTTSPSPSPIPTPSFNGKVYALFIGISDYPGFYNDLTYCDDDAKTLQSCFSASEMWDGASMTILTNNGASKTAIQNAIQSIKSKAGSEDRFIMTYSGHGTNMYGRAALCVWADGYEDWAYITDQELSEWLSGMQCSTAIFLDTCYSGGFIGKNYTKTVKGNRLTARVYADAPGYSADFTGTFNPASTRNVEDISNLVAVTGSRGTESSWESYELQHGVFSNYIIKGLGPSSSAGPANTNNNGSVSAEEIYNYCVDKVASYTDQMQNPQIVDNYNSSTDGGLPVKQ